MSNSWPSVVIAAASKYYLYKFFDFFKYLANLANQYHKISTKLCNLEYFSPIKQLVSSIKLESFPDLDTTHDRMKINQTTFDRTTFD